MVKLTHETKNEKSESHFLPQLKVPKKEKIVIEKLPINQSKLAIGCVFEQLTDFELRYVLSIYSFILGGSGDSLLFKNIREKKSLAYDVSSSYYKNDNISNLTCLPLLSLTK